jgi:hypothetical protein
MVFSFLPRLDYGWRASGFFGYPNHFAAFLEMTLPMGLGITPLEPLAALGKNHAGYFSAVCAVGIILSGSRGGICQRAVWPVCIWRAQLAGGEQADSEALDLSLRGGRRCRRNVPRIQRPLGDRRERGALRSRDPFGRSDVARIMLWKVAVKQFQLHPVFGAGSGFYRYYGREFTPLGVQADPEFAHNDYLQFLAEYGLVGAAGFLSSLPFILRGGWMAFHRTLSREPENTRRGEQFARPEHRRLERSGCVRGSRQCGFPAALPAATLVIAFVFGILANPGGEADVSSIERDAGFALPRQFRLLGPALGISILIFALPTLPAEIYAERARLILSDWRYMESPEIAKAAEQFARRGIRFDARNPELYYCLGEALIAQAAMTTEPAEKDRFYSEASLAYLRALSSAPRDSRLLLCLASALDAMKRFDEAEPLYAEAIRRDPISKYAHWEYGHHFELQHKLDEAEAAYRRSLSLGGGVSASAQMALDRIAESRKTQH